MVLIDRILKSYRPLIAIPAAITVIALLLVVFNGLNESVDLKGGALAELTLEKSVTQAELESLLREKLGTGDIKVLSIRGERATVQFGTDMDVVKVSEALRGTATINSYKAVGPVLSKQAMNQIYWAIGFAFLFMSVTVFIIFRDPVPSLAVILAAASDIIIAVGGMSLFGIPLSLASVGAILMLIGYSVDTDILLTTRVLKRRKGTINERALGAMKTGVTMSIAAIASMAALYLVTVFVMPEARVLSDIAAVLIIGLLADILTTWLMNLGILRWYLEVRS
ncbi:MULTISPECIES: protein translocase subunit SecF [Methanothermobacter]|uniref:Protein-export membrane protein SecF n=1 Tax=Methanothermobacter thermautotrophicus TaxID=145262 RepID=A0A7J4MWX0_METTF|nr:MULTISPECIES: protein translocase subunit SecF [Methanothermobacter]MBC7111351.1 protein translocase subunit SecF [Methanothermobacter sp.]HIH65105.1 protein translocase subunit SecF [Methanothermobacter thermautotrophicus]HIH71363.1 protein translocase subunit SecF [Methanothermobacter thermautotrophicus]